MEGSSNSDECFDRENVLVKSETQPLDIDLPLTSDGDNSSVASMNEDCESRLSSWDSEPETDIPSLINCHDMPKEPLEGVKLEENYLDIEEQNKFVGVENTDDGLLWEMDNRSYEELLKKFIEKEEELRVSNFKLQFSEQEIIKLNVQVENSEVLLDNVREELKLKEEELNKQKELSEEEIFKLKIQTENSEAQLDNVHEELKLKEEELNKLKKLSEEEIFNLKIQTENSEAQLGNLRKELKLKEEELNKLKARVLVSNRKQIKMVVDAANHEQEMQKLKSEMLDLQDKFSLEKDKLHFDIASLSKMKIELTSKLEDCQSRNKELENKLSRDRDAIVEKEMVLEEEMNCLKEELSQNLHLVEAGKKELEMAVIERDEANAKIDKLEAEICSSNDKLKLRATQEMVLQDKINCLREELGQKMHLVEAVNKKMKMVVIERDEANAKIDKLKNDILSCEDKSANMYNYVKELEASLTDMTVTYKACREEGKVLKLRLEEQLKKVISDKNEEKREAIKELEASLTKMTVIYKAYRDEGKMLKLRLEELKEVISDKDEEKREAIRQLCYSLEYYRSGYRELVQAINKVYRHR
ncbi:hypothetical protein P8452_28143 [Trifolium repens]|nr:protein NETWORKED 4B [Trifolium repens]WJX40695.1 hypothetical protein P8452_28143 [Trifolium repens]